MAQAKWNEDFHCSIFIHFTYWHDSNVQNMPPWLWTEVMVHDSFAASLQKQILGVKSQNTQQVNTTYISWMKICILNIIARIRFLHFIMIFFLYLSVMFLNFNCVFNWWLLILCNCDGVSRAFDCVCREAVQRSKEIIMASISEHIQNEFSKWQELQHQHDVKTSVSSSMVWFDFRPSQLWLWFCL